jgi:hypothetical protein
MNKDIKENEIYCPECGEIIKKNVEICTSCGVQLKGLNSQDKTVDKYKNKLTRQYKIIRISSFIAGGFFIIVGVLVLALAKNWAGLGFGVLGGLFVYLPFNKYFKPKTSNSAVKQEYFIIHFKWWDWLIYLSFGAAIIFFMPRVPSFFFRLLVYFGIGAGLWAIYYQTFLRLWVYLFPGVYKNEKSKVLICSNCRKVIGEDEFKCPNCGALFIRSE